MRLIGDGMTAKVYEYSPQCIAKVYNQDMPVESVEYEKSLLRIISDLDIKTAKYIDFQTVNGRPAIIMEKIDGVSFFAKVLQRPLNILSFIDALIAAQREIHQNRTDRLPSEKARFRKQVHNSGLDGSIQDKLCGLIDSLPDCDNVCHGDYHFGNIISSRDGLYAIDWMNSYRGNPVGDIFRSYLMMKSPFNPLPIKGVRKFAFMTFKSIVAEIYLSKALRARGLRKSEKRMWLAVVAAVRLCDNVPNEREWLVRLATRGANGMVPI